MPQALVKEKMIPIEVELESVQCCICGTDESSEVAKGQDYEYGSIASTFTYHQCKQCGHLYLNPRPTLNSGPTLYNTYYTSNKGSSNDTSVKRSSLVSSLAEKIMFNRIKPLLEYIPQGGSVLEIGFGNGEVLSALRENRKDINICGIDIKINIETKQLLNKKEITTYESSFETFKKEDLKADLIIMNQLIEHFWNVNESIEKIKDLLNKNGRVVIATPNTKGYDRQFFSKGAWGQYYWPRHMNLFNSESLGKLFKTHGLEVEKVTYLVCPVGWAQTVKYLTYRLGFHKLSSKINTYNPILLGLFTIIDLLAKTLRLQTSNMQIVFKKQ